MAMIKISQMTPGDKDWRLGDDDRFEMPRTTVISRCADREFVERSTSTRCVVSSIE